MLRCILTKNLKRSLSLICNNNYTSLHTQDLRLDVRYMLLNAKDLHSCAFIGPKRSWREKDLAEALKSYNKMFHI